MNQVSDLIDHPSHYQHASGVECADIIEHMPCCLANVVKYLWRENGKGAPLTDVKKAQWYAKRMAKGLPIDNGWYARIDSTLVAKAKLNQVIDAEPFDSSLGQVLKLIRQNPFTPDRDKILQIVNAEVVKLETEAEMVRPMTVDEIRASINEEERRAYLVASMANVSPEDLTAFKKWTEEMQAKAKAEPISENPIKSHMYGAPGVEQCATCVGTGIAYDMQQGEHTCATCVGTGYLKKPD